MTKPSLIISGGGAKGAFAVGVLKFLHQQTNLQFKLISGTSTGALISPLAATGRIELLEHLYTSIATRDVLRKGNVVTQVRKENHLFDTEPLLHLVRRYVTQEIFDQIAGSDIDYFNCCVSLQTGKVIHYSFRDTGIFRDNPYYEVRRIKNLQDFQWSIMASANQPVFTPPIIVDPEESRELCVDGGVRETIPITVALESGATELWVIDNNTILPDPMDRSAQFNKFFDVLKRTIHLFQKDVSYYDIEVPRLMIAGSKMVSGVRERLLQAGATDEVMKAFNDVVGDRAVNPFTVSAREMHVIRPKYKLAADGGLEFVPGEMRQMLNHGFEQARIYFEENQLTHRYKNGGPGVA